MKKIIFLLLLFTLFWSGTLLAESAAILIQLNRPDGLYVGKHRIAVSEGTTFYLYSARDYRFIGKFGKKGEGPREFKGRIDYIRVSKDSIIVSSSKKVSRFSIDGTSLQEVTTASRYGSRYTPIGNYFTGNGYAFSDKLLFQTINIYDSQLQKIKEIFRTKSALQRGKKIEIFSAAFDFTVCSDRVFITGNENFNIDVFDNRGKPLPSITRDYTQTKITDAHKEEVYEFFRTNPETKSRYEQIKQQLDFPSHFPAIRYIFSDDSLIYVHTYKKVKDKTEFFIFDARGTFQKKVLLPVFEANPIETNPIAFYQNRIYQLTENQNEEWELHITPF